MFDLKNKKVTIIGAARSGIAAANAVLRLGGISKISESKLLDEKLDGVIVEAGSVILQVFSFKLTGKRIFKMSPFHHHLQLSGWNENKIIVRFWILAMILEMLTITTLKIR